MQIIWLRAFVALSRQKSFSDAAAEMFISQSSFSKYIQSIEKMANVKLFDRSPRNIRLTAAGELFYQYAVGILQQYDEMMTVMREVFNTAQHKIKVASVPATHIYGYSSLFYEFCKNNPDIDFVIDELEMSAAMKALQDGEADFAVVRTNLVDEHLGYKELRFNTEEMLLVCGKSHPYAAKREVCLCDILKKRLVFQRFAFDEMKMLFAQHHFPAKDIKTCAVTTRNSTVVGYLRDGIGISIMSRTFADYMDPNYELLRIPIVERPQLTLGMLIKDGPLSPPCSKLMHFIGEAIATKRELPIYIED